jgi:ribosomal-protein-alanine N-acetyltransferase
MISPMFAAVNFRALEYRRLTPQWRLGLEEFCGALEMAGDADYFRPHPFTNEGLDQVVHFAGRDLYYVAVEGSSVLAYGMLRGWDAGFAIPSLGIAVHPSVRSCGLGSSLMRFLHVAALRRGAEKVRLKVHVDNAKAIELYRQLGYVFDSTEGSYYIGFKPLRQS